MDGEGRSPETLSKESVLSLEPSHQQETQRSRYEKAREAEQHALVSNDTEWNPGKRFYLAFASLLLLSMMVSLDSTIVSVALPTIARDLDGTAIEAFWTGTSFLLSSAVFLPTIGSLSHIFGRMQAIVTCTVFFLVGIVVSGVANNFTVMLAGRTVQGVGGGGLILLTEVVVTDLVPLRQRGAYLGLIGAMWAIGTVIGPVIGGVIAVRTTWRWIFWINIPLAAIALVTVPLFLRLNKPQGSMAQKLKRVDWVGSALFIASITSFLMPVSWGGVQFAWTAPNTLVPLLLGLAGLVAFAFYEIKIAKEPTVRFSLLRSYNMAYSLYGAIIHAIMLFGGLYFLPLYFEAAKRYTPVLAGVGLLPTAFTVAPFSIVAGIAITKTGDYRVVTWLGWIAATLGSGVMILLDVDSTVPQWIFLLACLGLGLGLLFNALVFITQAAADDGSVAFALGLGVFSRILGQCIGVAVCGTIFQNQMRARLLAVPALAPHADEYSRDASRLVATIGSIADLSAQASLIQAYADSLKIVWAVMCALSGSGLIGSLFVRKHSLDRVLNTEQGLKRGGSDDTRL